MILKIWIFIFITRFSSSSTYSATRSEYVITTPVRWASGTASQVCISFKNIEPLRVNTTHKFVVSIKSATRKPKNLVTKDVLFIQELGIQCVEIQLPITKVKRAQVSIRGKIRRRLVNHMETITITPTIIKTILQAEKRYYKPGETVRFRIITVVGPKLEISTKPYEEISIGVFLGAKIVVWKKVPNKDGLLHREYQIPEDIAHGSYVIKARTAGAEDTWEHISIGNNALPKYKIEIKKLKFIMAEDHYVIEVCARHAFGKPVKGNVSIIIESEFRMAGLTIITKEDHISGCMNFNYTLEEVNSISMGSYIQVYVVEQGSTVKREAMTNLVVPQTVLSFTNISPELHFKPRTVFVGEVRVTLPDKTPATKELMKVCHDKYCKEFITDKNGIVKFGIPPHLHHKLPISVTALNYPERLSNQTNKIVMKASVFHMHVLKYNSPSNSSLAIELPGNKLNCVRGNERKFSFSTSFVTSKVKRAKVTVQVISRGQIIFASNDATKFRRRSKRSININPAILLAPIEETADRTFRGSFMKRVKLSEHVTRKVQLLVFYSTSNGEVVSDSKTVNIDSCLPNPVNLNWSCEGAQPGQRTMLSLTAEPNSICSISVADKNIKFFDKLNHIATPEFLKIAESASAKYRDISSAGRNDEYCNYRTKRSNDESINRRMKRYSYDNSRYVYMNIDAFQLFKDAGVYVFSDMKLLNRPCNKVRGIQNYDDYRWRYKPIHPSTSKNRNKKIEPSILTILDDDYSPETWLWQFQVMNDTGIFEQNLILPDSKTEWAGYAVCVHPTKGVGISETVSISTFSNFVVTPASVKFEETFPVTVSLVNFQKESLPIKIVLAESSQYRILADEGYEAGSGEFSWCIPPKDKLNHSFRVRSEILGKIKIKVTAFVDTNSSTSCGKGTHEFIVDTKVNLVTVKYRGFEKEKVWSQYVCKEDNNVVDWSINEPDFFKIGSNQGYITATRSFIAPTIENLGKLFNQHSGLLKLTSSVMIMPYLLENQTAITDKAKGLMQEAHKSVLKYRLNDGSYSAYDKGDRTSSTWLTAYALTSLSRAREYIWVPSKDLKISQKWLQKKQMKNGCYKSVGKVIHKGLKSSSPTVITSHVAIALLAAGENSKKTTITSALNCLNADTNIDDSYALAVKAYALALVSYYNTYATITQLLANAQRSETSIHWPLTSYIGANVEVETAAYAVLAMLTLGPLEFRPEAKLVIKWMNSKRNGQGGFVSSLDTGIALQAMAKYDKWIKKEYFMSLVIDMSLPFLEFEKSATFNMSKNLQVHETKLPFNPLNVTFRLTGEGCVLIQAIQTYNALNPDTSTSFKLTVNTTSVSEITKPCKTETINVCVSYLLPDLVSNVGFIEVSMISGYVPLMEDLEELVRNATGVLKHYEMDDDVVRIFVDHFSIDELCVSFGVKREVEIEPENLAPGMVKVFDNDRPEYYDTEAYVFGNS